MNPHAHRLIFNPFLDYLVAVVKTGPSADKSGTCGTTRSIRIHHTQRHSAETHAPNWHLAQVNIAQAAATLFVATILALLASTISPQPVGSVSVAGSNISSDYKNRFQTGMLSTRDLDNQASASAESYQVSMGSAGVGQDRGAASSSTQAAISGIAGNQAVAANDNAALEQRKSSAAITTRCANVHSAKPSAGPWPVA